MEIPGGKRSKVNATSDVCRMANDPLVDTDSFPDAFSVEVECDAEVLGLSQTVRTYGELDVARHCIVLPGSGEGKESDDDGTYVKEGELLTMFVAKVKAELESTLLYQYATRAIKSNVIVESFKLLEAKFSDILVSQGNILSNTKLMVKLGPVMKVAARKELTNSLWFMHEPMGVVAEGIRLLYLQQEKTFDDVVFEKHTSQLVEEVEEFFWEVLSEGLFDLTEALKAYDHIGVVSCLSFFSKKENVKDIILEFACISAQRKERNEVGHPFGNHEVRIVAKSLLEELILDDHCANFLNVAVLSKLNLDVLDWKLPNPTEGDSWSKTLEDEMKELLFNMSPDDILEPPMGCLLDP